MKSNYSLKKKLASYSAFASVVLASYDNAEAQILYTDINPDDTTVATDVFLLDLNNDGNTDFKFNVLETGSGLADYVRAIAYGNNLISRDDSLYSGTWHQYYYAMALNAGAVVGGSDSFKDQVLLASHFPFAQYGNWSGTSGYLGLTLSP